MMNILLFLFFLLYFKQTTASVGDNSQYFINCVDKCRIKECEDDGVEFIESKSHPVYLKLLQWSCEEECEYGCMWKTVEAFQNRKYPIPQFHGKWPFIRLFGIQEPASALFSILNLYAHYNCLIKFRKDVRPDSPFYWLWHLYSFVCLNAWLWSTVFHTRDFPQTEFLDYSFAFSMVLMSCYCMAIRLLKGVPRFLLITITVFFVAFYANHIAYLKIGRFDYAYNMQVNILVGTFSAMCWFTWCIYNRYRKPYVWKCAAFVSLCGLTTFLEVFDRPPYFYVLDHHAIWHLSTAPLTYLFYSFITDDCKYLRKQIAQDEKMIFADYLKYEPSYNLKFCVILNALSLFVPVFMSVELIFG